jgi:hypothetical protein
MKKYEEEMFNFLTIEENFQGMLTAKNQFPMVKKKLISNLWSKVYQILKAHYKDKSEWIVKLDERLEIDTSKVYIYSKDLNLEANGLPPFLFGWERLSSSSPFYGFWVNHKGIFYDYLKIMDYLETQKDNIAPELEGRDEWWAFWDEDETLDFSNELTLVEILPAAVDSKAQIMADKIISLQKKMQEEYKFIKSQFKNNLI